MKIVLFLILSLFHFFVILLWHLIIIATFNHFLNEKEQADYLNSDEKKWEFFRGTVIIKHLGFIAKLPLNYIAKYYVDGLGIVPRESELHKKIEKFYEQRNTKRKKSLLGKIL